MTVIPGREGSRRGMNVPRATACAAYIRRKVRFLYGEDKPSLSVVTALNAMPVRQQRVVAVAAPALAASCMTVRFGLFTSICPSRCRERRGAAPSPRTRPFAVGRGALGDAVRLPQTGRSYLPQRNRQGNVADSGTKRPLADANCYVSATSP